MSRKTKKERSAAKSVTKAVILIIIAILLFSLALYFVVSYYFLPKPFDQQTVSETVEAVPVANSSEYDIPDLKVKQKNFLLVGTDTRSIEELGERSDSMILCSVQPEASQIKMISFMRDMYVDIPARGKNRINTAFSDGGIYLLEATLKSDFDVRVDNYIKIDFDGFIKAIGVIGNLDIELTQAEADYMNTHTEYGSRYDTPEEENWQLTEGLNSLTPEQVLCYSRMRHVGNSDWERTDRQRRVLMLLFDKIKESGIVNVLNLATNIRPYIETDADLVDLVAILKVVMFGGNTELQSYRIPAEGTYTAEEVKGMAVLVTDQEANKKYIHDILNNTLAKDPGPEEDLQQDSTDDSVI